MQVLRNRMENGTPFLKSRALERIRALADNLESTEQEEQELRALAEAKGLEVLPQDALGRLTALEETTEDLTLILADMMGGAV